MKLKYGCFGERFEAFVEKTGMLRSDAFICILDEIIQDLKTDHEFVQFLTSSDVAIQFHKEICPEIPINSIEFAIKTLEAVQNNLREEKE